VKVLLSRPPKADDLLSRSAVILTVLGFLASWPLSACRAGAYDLTLVVEVMFGVELPVARELFKAVLLVGSVFWLYRFEGGCLLPMSIEHFLFRKLGGFVNWDLFTADFGLLSSVVLLLAHGCRVCCFYS
jgi:hypothetical protein